MIDISISKTIFILTILLTGLSAGLFFGWSVSVIPGIRCISDRNYLKTMQSINRAILNPWFFIIFFGSGILLIVSSIEQFRQSVDASFWTLVCATMAYLAGTTGITILGNVPLNNMLDSLSIQDLSPDDLKQLRQSFESRWNRFHMIRTVFAVSAFLLLIMAMLKKIV